ncbi:MAG TPA: LexA family transcriptional regulator [Deltaproteobacteria bacterium]|nr:LexA family transcriptional regulator [Deltaproteobacteria bacterium]HQB38475.1 LexA family transcriptional regulator [Deltaproteobacteria bacterium]
MSNIVNRKVTSIHDDCSKSGKLARDTARLRLPGGQVTVRTKDVLSRLKEELGIQMDVELAEVMSVGIRRIHNWKQRNTVPTEAIVAICGSEGLDLEFILTGNRSNMGRCHQAGGKIEVPHCSDNQPRVVPPNRRFEQCDSAGNQVAVFDSPQLVDVLAPGTNWLIHALGVQPEHLLLMKVIGDNMAPWVQDGDLVFVDTANKSTINGGVLALRYADGTMIVRRVYRNQDGTLHARCDSEGCDAEILDISNEDMYPLVVGRVVRRLVR